MSVVEYCSGREEDRDSYKINILIQYSITQKERNSIHSVPRTGDLSLSFVLSLRLWCPSLLSRIWLGCVKLLSITKAFIGDRWVVGSEVNPPITPNKSFCNVTVKDRSVLVLGYVTASPSNCAAL